jgi:hypothetical protein
MRVLKLSVTIFFLSITSILLGQNGYLRGTVYEGTTKGTITDLDGKFNLPLPAGTYQIRVSFISYETLTINDVEIKANDVTVFDNIKLSEATVEIGEAVVTAKAIHNTEAAMLTMKQKSANLLDGISASALQKIGDSDAAASMKRVTGVSVEGGKYVFVRGLGDRYTKTLLNGLDIPGLDPDRNTIQMDIFPTSIVENLVVNKTFSADLPADFTGGVIDINIKDFPVRKTGNFSLSAGYNSGSSFNKNFVSAPGGKTDWLGFDDGTRDIPATTNIPFLTDAITSESSATRYKEILSSFNPNMAATRERSLMDFSLSASLGNQIKLGKYDFGYLVSASYKNNTDYYEGAEYGRYGLASDVSVTEMETRELTQGDYGVNTVLWSALGGLALKSTKAKYRINFLHLQNGESKAAIFDYEKNNYGTTISGIQHNIEYSQRSLTNVLLSGNYNYYDKGWQIEWKLSPTLSRIDEPDIRFTRYLVENDRYIIGTESGFPERIWRELEEKSFAGVLHFTKNLKINSEDAKWKFGGAYTYKDRTFAIRDFSIVIKGSVPLTGDPNEIFAPENLWPYNGEKGSGTTYEAAFIPTNYNSYDATVSNIGGYTSLEFNPLKKLKSIIGVRTEQYMQHYTGKTQQGAIDFDNEKVLDNLDFFPTVNLIYSLNDEQNLRFSYAKTIARPSFKELSYAQIFDPISGKNFFGGMFPDYNDQTKTLYWDGNLTKTDIQNLDLRWEIFKPAGQTVSIGAFYKNFKKPIEIVQYSKQPGSYQPRNVGDGTVIGGELELRHNLEFVGESLKNMSLQANFTYTHSRIKLSDTEYDSRIQYARDGESISHYRDMAGQAPYIVNAGISFDGSENGFGKGLNAGLYYNVQGESLMIVGITDRPDVYNVPFHSLNFNASKALGEAQKWKLGLKIENLLNSDKEAVYKNFGAKNQYYSKLSPGITFQLKVSYAFF